MISPIDKPIKAPMNFKWRDPKKSIGYPWDITKIHGINWTSRVFGGFWNSLDKKYAWKPGVKHDETMFLMLRQPHAYLTLVENPSNWNSKPSFRRFSQIGVPQVAMGFNRKIGQWLGWIGWEQASSFTLPTVDWKKPAPVDKWFIPLFIGFQPSFLWCRILQPSTVSFHNFSVPGRLTTHRQDDWSARRSLPYANDSPQWCCEWRRRGRRGRRVCCHFLKKGKHSNSNFQIQIEEGQGFLTFSSWLFEKCFSIVFGCYWLDHLEGSGFRGFGSDPLLI